MRLLFFPFFIFLSSFVQAQGYTPVDAKSKVYFKIKNFGSTVDGTFSGLKGTITFDNGMIQDAFFDVTVNATTIDTGIRLRNNHVRKSDYFAVTDFPTIRFISTKVEKSNKSNEAIETGKLTIKKITKEISILFHYSKVNGVLRFEGEFKINRRDFSVGGNSLSLSDEVNVKLDVWASKNFT